MDLESGVPGVILRDYQRECIAAIENDLERVHRTVAVLPTGAGKTTVFAEWGRLQVARWDALGEPGRVLYLAHRDELIDQAAARLRAIVGGQTVGIVQGHRNSTLARHIVASVQTLGGERGRRRRAMLRDVRRVVVDECHHAPAQSYVDVLTAFGAMSGEGARAVGFTATLSRSDGKALGAIWQSVAYEKSIAWMIERNYLVRPRGIRVRVEDLDLTKVRRTMGDFSEAGLGEAIEKSMAPEAIVKAWLEHASDRPTLVFLPTVHSAGVVEQAFREIGVTTALIHGKMPKDERRKALQAFRDGDVQVLCNCMVLTEGTDLPMASCAVIARPTSSQGLYVQMVGRVLRLHDGKVDAIVLDVVGASRLGLQSTVDLFGDEAIGTTARVPCECVTGEECRHKVCWADCVCGGPDGSGDCGCLKAEVPESAPAELANGPVVSTIVDLFNGSEMRWQRTERGVPFLAAGERFIAIVPTVLPPPEDAQERDFEPGADALFDVISVHWKDRSSARWVQQGLPTLAEAMRYGEDDVTKVEMATAKKEVKRRGKGIWATETQKAEARRMGISPDAFTSASELQVRLSIAAASARIDGFLPTWYQPVP